MQFGRYLPYGDFRTACSPKTNVAECFANLVDEGGDLSMKKVAVITDSNSGITQEKAKKLGITVLPMPFFINDELYYEDITLSQEEFYRFLAQNADVKT